MKNHRVIDGKLIQMNKKICHLKSSQKEYIYNLFKDSYLSFFKINNRFPNKIEKENILTDVYRSIKEKEISISFSEVNKYYNSKKNKIKLSLKQ